MVITILVIIMIMIIIIVIKIMIITTKIMRISCVMRQSCQLNVKYLTVQAQATMTAYGGVSQIHQH
jgi:hypothetical protein